MAPGQAVDHRFLIGMHMAVAVSNAMGVQISMIMGVLFLGGPSVIVCHRRSSF